MLLHPPSYQRTQLNDFQLAISRVRDYLEREWFARQMAEGSKLPPVRLISKELGVSNAAVYAVYRELQEAGRVVSVVGRGTFIAPGHARHQKLHFAVSLAVNSELQDNWRNEIITGILLAAGEHPEATVRPLGHGLIESEEIDLASLRSEISRIDGLIILPMRHDLMGHLEEFCREMGKPMVRINPPAPFQTENFVSSDYYRFGVEMGKVWLESGRRKIVLLGGVHAPSWVQRIAGFQTAMGKHPERMELCCASGIGYDDGYQAIKALLESGYQPDAVFAFGDLLALGARDALREAGYSIPGDVSIMGGTGSAELNRGGLSTQANDYLGLGRATLNMMIERNHRGGESVPAVYVPIGFTPGGSTRPLEYTIWKQRKKL